MREAAIELTEAMFEAFTARDVEAMVGLLDPEMEFFPIGTARLTGSDAPYRGHDGMRRYFADVEDVWQELRVVPQHYELTGDRVLVTGRVYARDRQGGVIDSPAGWLWEIKDRRFTRGQVFDDPDEARKAAAAAASEA
jgi:ketosteroid isomerase-like protein